MSKKNESVLDCCIRILRMADASDEAKDLAEAVLRQEIERPVQRIVDTVYRDRSFPLPHRDRLNEMPPQPKAFQVESKTLQGGGKELTAFLSLLGKSYEPRN